jgi:murein L,D-transpeptidase YafK
MSRIDTVFRPALVSAILFASPIAFSQTAPAASIAFSNEVEASLVRAMETLKGGNLQSALQEIDVALQKEPKFLLGYFIKGDLLMARAGSPAAFGPHKTQGEMVASLRDEARVRLTRYFDAPPSDYLPGAVMQLSPEQSHVIVVDSSKSRLYVFKNIDGRPQYVTDFYISAGKNGIEKEREGDAKTPLGVYRVTSTIPKDKLPDLYGSGAFPLNYPNEVDKKLGKNGSGIWIHGTPSSTYSRPPRASDGCVVLTNDDFERISSFIDPGTTPVVIAPSVEWKSPEQWHQGSAEFIAALNRWKHDWESLDADAYLSHYSKFFNTDGKRLDDWGANKRRINSTKSFIKVEISNLSVFEYPMGPGYKPFVMVTFDQDYKSSNNATRMKKRQYWQLEDGSWRIVYESAAT